MAGTKHGNHKRKYFWWSQDKSKTTFSEISNSFRSLSALAGLEMKNRDITEQKAIFIKDLERIKHYLQRNNIRPFGVRRLNNEDISPCNFIHIPSDLGNDSRYTNTIL